MGSSARQLSVGLYSTRTGTSRYSRRVTSPSCSSSRRAEASTVLEMPSSLPRSVVADGPGVGHGAQDLHLPLAADQLHGVVQRTFLHTGTVVVALRHGL